MKQVMTDLKMVILALALSLLSAGQVTASSLNTASDQANFAGWLSEEVKTYLKAELAGSGHTIESIKVSLPSLIRPPEGYDSFKISIPHQGGKSSKVFLLVSFSAEGRVIARVNVISDVKVLREVVVAGKDISRGAVIGAQDVEVVTRSTGPFISGIVSDLSQVIGLQADRNIRSGVALRPSQLSWPKMVRAGDIVSVIAESGPMKITVTGEAKQDGNRGEWIKVINTESKRTINARVTGPGEVMVEF